MTSLVYDDNEYDQQQSWAEKPAVRFWNGRYWAYSYPRDRDYEERVAQAALEGLSDDD